MRKISGETLIEAGKHFLNIGLAILVAFFLQPLVYKRATFSIYFIGVFSWFILFMTGIVLINLGSKG